MWISLSNNKSFKELVYTILYQLLTHSIQYYYHYSCAKDAGIPITQERLIDINFTDTSNMDSSNRRSGVNVKV